AVAYALRGRLVVVVVPLEPGVTVATYQLADRLVAVHEPAVVVELRRAALFAGLRVHDDDVGALPRPRLAERLLGTTRHAHNGNHALAPPVVLDQPAPEAGLEALAVQRRGLGPEPEPEAVVVILGCLRHRQDVRQRTTHVVEVRGAVPAHVGQEPRRRELAAQR